MIPKFLIEKLINNTVYIFVKGIQKEFAGVVKSIENDMVLLDDNKNNIIYIPLSDIMVITERR